MGKWWMPNKKSSDEFESQAKEMGYETRVEEDKIGGGFNVVTEDDEGGASKSDYVETITKKSRDDWDDALPDESPIGKSQSELDAMEQREDERLGRKPSFWEKVGDSARDLKEDAGEFIDDAKERQAALDEKNKSEELENVKRKAEIEKAKAEIRKAKHDGKSESSPGGIQRVAKSTLGLLGVGKINKSAMGLYLPSAAGKTGRAIGGGRPDLYGGAGLENLRALTSPQGLRMPIPTVSIKGNVGGMKPMSTLSPIAAMATKAGGFGGISPLSVAALNTEVNQGISPLAQAATRANTKGIIGMAATNLNSNPAFSNGSIIAKIAKQSAIIKAPNMYNRNINKLKRG